MQPVCEPTPARDSGTGLQHRSGRNSTNKLRNQTPGSTPVLKSGTDSGTNARAQFDQSGIALPAKLLNTLVFLVPGSLVPLGRSPGPPSLPLTRFRPASTL
jgi:hypothetical protein